MSVLVTETRMQNGNASSLGVPANEETGHTFLLKGGVQILSFFEKVLQAMRKGVSLHIQGTCELLCMTALGVCL